MADETVEGVILMFENRVRGADYLIEKLFKLHVLRQPRTDGQDVYETTDLVLQIGMVSIGHDCAHTEIILTTDLEEEQLEQCKHDRGQRGSPRCRNIPELLRRFWAEV